MTTHTLNSIKNQKKQYNKMKKLFEKRGEELIKLKEIQENNLKITKQMILNNKAILYSKISIENFTGSKK